MANRYFYWPTSLKRFLSFDSARAGDVNNALDQLSSGLDTLQGDVDRSLKLPTGTADQTLALTAAQRANLVVSFDAAGNVTAIRGGFSYRGDWATATQYYLNDVVRDATSKNLYVCLAAHTSGVLAADIAAGKFGLAINVADVEVLKNQAGESATNAANSATASANSATNSASSATASANSATGSANSAAAAQDWSTKTSGEVVTGQGYGARKYANDAAASAAAAAATYATFHDQYLGPKAADPTTDNDGNALQVGAMYWSIPAGEMRAYNGSAWVATYLPASGYATLATAQPLTNKTIDYSLNTIINLPAPVRSPRTANTMLGVADNAKLIDITSGTFTQTFDSAATLKNGWYCWLRNNGSGDVTLKPNGAELIDGMASYIMYPGEYRLVVCDGAALYSVVLKGFSKASGVAGTFIKPPGYSAFQVRATGAGCGGAGGGGGGAGGGGASTSRGGGGGGGGCAGTNGQVATKTISAANMPASVPYTPGAGSVGGAGGNGANGTSSTSGFAGTAGTVPASPGGASTFGTDQTSAAYLVAAGGDNAGVGGGAPGAGGGGTSPAAGGNAGANTVVIVAATITSSSAGYSATGVGSVGTAGSGSVNTANSAGANGGVGGSSAASPYAGTLAAAAAGTGASADGTAGGTGAANGQAAPGQGGAGGSGGGGSRGATVTTSSAGGKGADGGKGGDGYIEILGLV